MRGLLAAALVRIDGRAGSPPQDGITDLVLDAASISKLSAGGKLPLESGSARGIAVTGLVARLDDAGLASLLRECRRALRRGGVLRAAFGSGDSMLRAKLTRLAAWSGFAPGPERADGESAVPEFHDLDGAHAGGALEFVKPARSARGSTTPVSIVIPAYNPRYFGEALDSALAQTHPDVEVIVSDDDETGGIEAICEKRIRAGRRVRLSRNAPRLGGCGNYIRCFELAGGEYVKFLNDDDRLHPECVERMADVLDQHADVTLVTSHRRLIDGPGNPLGEIASTRPPVTHDAVLDGASVAGAVLALNRNFIGEPTTVLFRKADLAGAAPSVLSFAGREYDWNVDVAMWLTLLSRGDAAYLIDSLSDFRLHAEQAQQWPDAEARGVVAWKHLREDAAALGLWHPTTLPSVSIVAREPGAARARERKSHGAGAIDAARAAFADALQTRD